MGFNFVCDCKVMFCSVFLRNYTIVSFAKLTAVLPSILTVLSRAGTDSVKSWRRLISGEL